MKQIILIILLVIGFMAIINIDKKEGNLPVITNDISNIQLNWVPAYGFYVVRALDTTTLGFFDGSSYQDRDSLATPQQIKIRLQNTPSTPAGKIMTIIYNGGTVAAYLPAFENTIEIFVDTQGNTYYDSALTQLAQSATTCNNPADTNTNCIIVDSELISYINRWLSSQVTDSQLISVINIWINGGSYQ